MKQICVHLLVYFSACVALAFAVTNTGMRAECAPAALPAPLFVWTPHSELPISHTPKNQLELQSALQGMISPFGRALALGTPEVIVVFVHKLLRSDEVSRLSDAYSVNSGGALSELKAAFTNAESKAYSANYFAYDGGSRLSEFLRNEFARTVAQSGSTAIIASDDAPSTSVDSLGIVHTTFDDLVNEMTARGVATNGRADVVIVLFDSYCGASEAQRRELISQDDALVGRVMSAAGNQVVAVFTADGATPSSTMVLPPARHMRGLLSTSSSTNSTNNTNTTTGPTLMSIPVAAGLLTAALGLVIALLGFCCLFQLQTPVRFESPDKSGIPQQQAADD